MKEIKTLIEKIAAEKDYDGIINLIAELRGILKTSYDNKQISNDEIQVVTKEVSEALKRNPLYTIKA